MRAILYSHTDYEAVAYIHDLFKHVLECDGCAEHVRKEGKATTDRMFGFLSGLTSGDITNVADAVEFCNQWMALHEMLSNVDALIEAVPTNAKPN